jgi:hypothetical protein
VGLERERLGPTRRRHTSDRRTVIQVIALTGITRIAAGFRFTLALTRTGTVKAWGDNTYGELGSGTTQGNTPLTVPSITGATQNYGAPGRIVVASQGTAGSATTPTANLRAAALTGRSSAEASAGAVRLFRALPAAKAGGQTLTGLIGFEEGPPAMVPTGAEGPLPTTGPGFQFRGGIGGRAKTSASRASASWTRRHDTDGAWST